MEQARKVPALIEQLRAEAPERFEAVRNTDPKAVQERVATQAREAQAAVQAKMAGVLEALDTDLKTLGENAQDLALRSVGVAAEYAVRARETYEKVAERGEQSVRTWRGETAEEIVEIATVVDVEPKPVARQKAEAADASAMKPAVKPEPKAEPKSTEAEAAPVASARKTAPARKPAVKKTAPPSAK